MILRVKQTVLLMEYNYTELVILLIVYVHKAVKVLRRCNGGEEFVLCWPPLPVQTHSQSVSPLVPLGQDLFCELRI